MPIKKLALALTLLLFPTFAFADDIAVGNAPDAATKMLTVPAPLPPSNPLPIAQNMIGALAGEVATLRAQLNDANQRIAQIEAAIKDAAVQAARPK